MIPDSFQHLIRQIIVMDGQFNFVADTGFLIFSRILGFIMLAPAFGRKDIPFPIKMAFAMTLTWVLMWTMVPDSPKIFTYHSDNLWMYSLQIFANVSVGALIGFISATIYYAINAAGSIMNNQIGLSSAMLFDPGSQQQVALLEKVLGMVGLIALFNMGGHYWLLSALQRSFEVFPVHTAQPDIIGKINLNYLAHITGNTITIGLVLVSPVMVVTMGVDLILGIVNRTAQQIQVFQLSFALKPLIGLGAFLLSLPIFIKVLEYYLSDYARIF
jgi:flagellar biosynthesis protein FliR